MFFPLRDEAFKTEDVQDTSLPLPLNSPMCRDSEHATPSPIWYLWYLVQRLLVEAVYCSVFLSGAIVLTLESQTKSESASDFCFWSWKPLKKPVLHIHPWYVFGVVSLGDAAVGRTPSHMRSNKPHANSEAACPEAVSSTSMSLQTSRLLRTLLYDDLLRYTNMYFEVYTKYLVCHKYFVLTLVPG